MTLPVHSGNMSQLYRGFSWISMMANMLVQRLSRRYMANLTPSRAILQALNSHFSQSIL
jgi:hypothetical protein